MAADTFNSDLRAFDLRDIAAAQALSSTFGWPHRLEDWQFALSLGQGVVAERDGNVLGTALSWKWGERHGTIGLVIVAPELHGQRIGNRMMSYLLDHLAGRDVLLHSTEAGRGLYERLGFVAIGEVDQHQGVLLQSTPELPVRPRERVRALQPGDAEALVALDLRATGMPRPELLHRVFAQDRTIVLERRGEIAGFAVLRRYGRGHAVGPVAAPDADAAQVLVSHCCRQTEGFVRIDVHSASGLSTWLETLGLPRVGGGTVMVRGRPPERGPAHGGWALFTQAIG